MQYKPKPPAFGLNSRAAVATIVLASSAFAWYFLAFSILRDYFLPLVDSSAEVLILSANVGAIVAAALAGTYFIGKYKKRVSFLKRWMFAGIFVSIIPVVFTPSTVPELIIVSIILGGYFGFGMPSTMGYFSVTTENRNRARVSGVTFLSIGLAFFVFAILLSLSTGSTFVAGLILLTLRLGSFVVFYALEKNEVATKDTAQIKYSKLIANRSFLLFLIPWLVFNLINYLTTPFTDYLAEKEFVHNINLYEQILIAIFAVATGILADRYGRKRLAIFGFVMLGLGYAALGLLGGIFGWYIYILADGAAWGIFSVLFLFTLWGDLSQDFNSEKAYVIGSIPYLFSVLMQVIFTPLMVGSDPPAATTVFSFASFFLFIAVLPLFYAPETLSEKIMKDHDLNSYIEKAKKIAEKEEGKKQKVDEQNEDLHRDSEETAEEKKARELAEKYY